MPVKAKFHYASWFGDGSEPASVMEFGFNQPFLRNNLFALSRRGDWHSLADDVPVTSSLSRIMLS